MALIIIEQDFQHKGMAPTGNTSKLIFVRSQLIVLEFCYDTASCNVTYPHRNIRHCFQTILKEEGGFWRGCLYRGLSPTLMVCEVVWFVGPWLSLLLQGIAPYVGLNFAVYETLKGLCIVGMMHPYYKHIFPVYFLSHSQDTELSVPLRLCCGAVAGATAQSSKGTYHESFYKRP